MGPSGMSKQGIACDICCLLVSLFMSLGPDTLTVGSSAIGMAYIQHMRFGGLALLDVL